MNIHEALFKSTFTQVEHAAPALRHILGPARSARIDFSSLQVVPGSFVEEAVKDSHTDILYKVSLAGDEAFLYVLWEHQSTPSPPLPDDAVARVDAAEQAQLDVWVERVLTADSWQAVLA